MTWALLAVLVAAALAMISRCLRDRSQLLQFEFLTGCVLLFWYVPQAAGMRLEQWGVAEEDLALGLAMASLCAGAVLVGSRRRVSVEARRYSFRCDDRRLLAAAGALLGIGYWSYYQLRSLPVEMLRQSGWQGPPTIFAFFANLVLPGFSLSLLLFLRRPGLMRAALTVAGSVFPLEKAVLWGQRSDMVQFGVAVAVAFYFARGWRPSRTAVMAAVVGMVVLSQSIGEYRRAVVRWGGEEREWHEVLNIDFVGNYVARLREGVEPDVRNGILLMNVLQEAGGFHLGIDFWNLLVGLYVPGQLIGYEAKSAMMIPVPGAVDTEDLLFRRYQYAIGVGNMTTGIYDAFANFWFFGALLFYALARFFRRLWAVASIPGNTVVQAAYAWLLVEGLQVVPQGIVIFWAKAVYVGGLVYVIYRLARVEKRAPVGSPVP